jgi:hypothetical protein
MRLDGFVVALRVTFEQEDSNEELTSGVIGRYGHLAYRLYDSRCSKCTPRGSRRSSDTCASWVHAW